jgi:CTD kinase subunit alpha
MTTLFHDSLSTQLYLLSFSLFVKGSIIIKLSFLLKGNFSLSLSLGETELAKPQMAEPSFSCPAATDIVHFLSPHHFRARYVAMKDSWGNGDDRRDRGRVDRGVTRPRRSRSPPPRRSESAREPKGRDRSPISSRPTLDYERPRERSQDHRRRLSRSPLRDSREDVRERNRGRELLDTRGSDKPKRSTRHSPSSVKRRKSRSVSPTRDHHKKSRRGASRSPPRLDSSHSSRPEKKRRSLSPLPPRRRSLERKTSDIRGENRHRHHRESGFSSKRGRSPSPKRDRHEPSHRGGSRHHPDSKPDRSPQRSPGRSQKSRDRSRSKDRGRKREHSPNRGRRSGINPYELENRSRPQSPQPQRDYKARRGYSPQRTRGDRAPRDEYRNSKPPRKSSSKDRKPSFSTSRSNSIEVIPDKMAGRGYYGGPQGYNPSQQMQAAFPLKPQYNQGAPDPRQYSQSPQHHMTPNSYQSSPQAQSPYNSGRSSWGGQPPQQYSPQP